MAVIYRDILIIQAVGIQTIQIQILVVVVVIQVVAVIQVVVVIHITIRMEIVLINSIGIVVTDKTRMEKLLEPLANRLARISTVKNRKINRSRRNIYPEATPQAGNPEMQIQMKCLVKMEQEPGN